MKRTSASRNVHGGQKKSWVWFFFLSKEVGGEGRYKLQMQKKD
uniref:Uncharacterized protein n=1 Tax=Nelumbo nucifera TaxID=4432 RepID=A0A822XWH1_NELNU|nr:TPA_asm: hypothetical protein HUJ06_027452 [Nelumbo nucifera]